MSLWNRVTINHGFTIFVSVVSLSVVIAVIVGVVIAVDPSAVVLLWGVFWIVLIGVIDG